MTTPTPQNSLQTSKTSYHSIVTVSLEPAPNPLTFRSHIATKHIYHIFINPNQPQHLTHSKLGSKVVSPPELDAIQL